MLAQRSRDNCCIRTASLIESAHIPMPCWLKQRVGQPDLGDTLVLVDCEALPYHDTSFSFLAQSYQLKYWTDSSFDHTSGLKIDTTPSFAKSHFHFWSNAWSPNHHCKKYLPMWNSCEQGSIWAVARDMLTSLARQAHYTFTYNKACLNAHLNIPETPCKKSHELLSIEVNK